MTQPTHSGSATQPSQVLLETREGSIVTLTMNRPERLNALDNALSTALNTTLERISTDGSVNVVILTGAGRGFCAGGDLGVIGQGREKNDVAELGPILRSGMQAVLRIRMMPQPVIAAINGPAAGAGLNLALATDIRICTEEAVLGENFSKVGLFPDYGGTFFLPQIVGPSIACEMFYTGEMIDAKRAHQLGIVNHIFAADRFAASVRELANKIASGPQIAIRAVKQAIFGRDQTALTEALEREVDHQLKCFHSQDCREGIQAFLEKRPPNFKGH